MRKQFWIFLIILLLGLTLSGIVVAQTSGLYDLSWHTIDGGGGSATGGGYTLTGSVGQPDAGAAMTGGGYSLKGGFWNAGGDSTKYIYLPLVLK